MEGGAEISLETILLFTDLISKEIKLAKVTNLVS
jgi:hypothetical protein